MQYLNKPMKRVEHKVEIILTTKEKTYNSVVYSQQQHFGQYLMQIFFLRLFNKLLLGTCSQLGTKHWKNSPLPSWNFQYRLYLLASSFAFCFSHLILIYYEISLISLNMLLQWLNSILTYRYSLSYLSNPFCYRFLYNKFSL